MVEKKVKYLIIGAGISGLTFANYIKEDYLIVEKEDEVGGYCRTIKKGDFIWDYAGHFFHFKTEEFRNKFLSEVDEKDVIYKEKCTKILYKENLIDYPFQSNIHQLEKQEFIDCLYDLYFKTEKENYDNFLDMLYGKFGKSIVEKFLKPYNEKLYAVDLSNLDVEAMGRFFPYANLEEIIANMKRETNSSYNNNFLYPRKGAGSFIDILYNKLDRDKILLNTKITQIDESKKTAYTADGQVLVYEYLINTSPLNIFLEILQNSNELKEELSYNKVLVFNLGFDKKSKFTKEHWIYIPSKECNYYRLGFYDNILDSDKLSMYIEIGYPKKSTIDENEIKRQLELTLKNLKDQKIVEEDMKLEEYVAIVMDPAYVHINNKTDKKVKEFMKMQEQNNIYTIGRYGAWTYCSMEDSMLQAKELAEKLKM